MIPPKHYDYADRHHPKEHRHTAAKSHYDGYREGTTFRPLFWVMIGFSIGATIVLVLSLITFK